MSKKKSVILSVVFLLVFAVLSVSGYFVYEIYKKIFSPNVNWNKGEQFEVFIPSKANFDTVVNLLEREKVIIDRKSFITVAGWMKYPNRIYPGKYIIQAGQNNIDLVRFLRSGKQSSVKLIINNIKTKQDLILLICSKLETDSLILDSLLNDKFFLQKYELTPENSIAVFIPNTYQFYWNTDAIKLFERMIKEYKNFWNNNRMEKIKMLNRTPLEIITIASIVEQETTKQDEKTMIAGVYLNRLERNWKLQADPTVKFAMMQFDLQRVLIQHTLIESPYNTYLHEGLPPGPICLPEITTIDAVLNYQGHNYMYFCAKEDFSGYHNFAITLHQHLSNARKFQQSLNKNRIW